MANRFYLSLLTASTLALSTCGDQNNNGSENTFLGSQPADITAPVISISPNDITVNAGEEISVSISAVDNFGIASGPTVSCSNNASFADNIFTAPSVTQNTTSLCTVTASDRAGNETTENFTVTIIAPDGFTVSGTASKGLLLRANVRLFDMDDVLNGMALRDTNAIGTAVTSATDGSFMIEMDVNPSTLGRYLLTDVVINGSDMICDAVLGCSENIAFGETLTIAESSSPTSLKAIIPTPNNQDSVLNNVNIFTALQSELILERTEDLGVTQVRAQDIAESQLQVATLFGIADEDFTELNFVNIAQTDFENLDTNTIEANVLAGGILGAISESPTDPLTDILELMFSNFRASNGELIGREVQDDKTVVSLVDIFENASLIKNLIDTPGANLLEVQNKFDRKLSELDRSLGGAPTGSGMISFHETGNTPPSFVNDVDYVINDNDTLSFLLNPTFDSQFFDLSLDGRLALLWPLDTTNPADTNSDNIYELDITLFDGKDQRGETIFVTVSNDIVEAGFTLNGISSKGLMKGQMMQLRALNLSLIANAQASQTNGQFTIPVSGNLHFDSYLSLFALNENLTMVCDAPRGCGDNISFGEDFQPNQDRSILQGALIKIPSGETEVDAHVNVFTELVRNRIIRSNMPATDNDIAAVRNEIATLFNITPQNYSSLEFVDATNPSLVPPSFDAVKSALIFAGVMGAAYETPIDAQDNLIDFYNSFGDGSYQNSDNEDPTRISLVDILTHASEVRNVNASQNSLFLRALDSIDADLAVASAN